MPLITLTYDLTDGADIIYGSDVIQNFNDILAVVNGGLADDNFSGAANIKGTRISSAPGERVPETRIEDNAVGAAKLRSEALDINDALRAVTNDHVRNSTIRKGKLSTTAGQKLTVAQMELTIASAAIAPTAGSTLLEVTAAVTNSNTLEVNSLNVIPTIVGPNWHFRVVGLTLAAATAGDFRLSMFDFVVDPNTIGLGNITTAGNMILGCWLQGATVGAGVNGVLNGTLLLHYLAKT